jgi:hypothetical protein
MKYLKKFENYNIIESILPQYWYHGTNEDFDKFDVKYLGKNYESSILGIYFTQYLQPPPYGSTAVEYAKNIVSEKGGKPFIYKCQIKLNNPLIVDSKGYYNSNFIADSHREKLIRQRNEGNHDGIIIYNSEGHKLPDYITDEDVIKNHNQYDIENMDFILITQHPEKIKIIEKMTIK